MSLCSLFRGHSTSSKQFQTTNSVILSKHKVACRRGSYVLPLVSTP